MQLKLFAAFRLRNRAQTLRPGTLLQQFYCVAIASDTDTLEFHNSVGFSGFVQHGR